MSFDNGNKLALTLPAGADLSGKQYHAVVVNSSGAAAAAGADAGGQPAARVKPPGWSFGQATPIRRNISHIQKSAG